MNIVTASGAILRYRHLSSKRRIETLRCLWRYRTKTSYRHLSSKRRIETISGQKPPNRGARLPAFIQQKKDWNHHTKRNTQQNEQVTGIYPAKEGLKHAHRTISMGHIHCYRHLSSKRRIETPFRLFRRSVLNVLPAFIQQKKDWNMKICQRRNGFLPVTGIYPAKEGLKQSIRNTIQKGSKGYRHLSSKRRIETTS